MIRKVFAIGWKVALAAVIIAALGLLFGLIVKGLWNWVMCGVFGLRRITFWEAWGLFILAHLLFGREKLHVDHSRRRKEREPRHRVEGPVEPEATSASEAAAGS